MGSSCAAVGRAWRSGVAPGLLRDVLAHRVLAFLPKNALGLPSLGHAPSALPGRVGGSGRWQMTYDMSLHTFERPSCSHCGTRTHRTKPSQRARAAESPTPPYVRVSTASSRSTCAPSRCKRTRHLKVKRKSRPALCVSTAKRCCCHQDGGRGRVDGRLQEDEGGGSPEDGYVLEGTAVQPRW